MHTPFSLTIHRATTLALALAAVPALAAGAAPGLPIKPTVGDIVKASSASDWRPLDPDNTLYMELPGGRVVIELAPDFAPQNVANIKLLTREHYYDGQAVVRSQDNYVAQWGDADEAHPKPLKTAREKVPGEFTVALKNDRHITALPERDGYAPQVGISNGFPAGRDPRAGRTWLAHCYGMVGVGRDVENDSGNGTSLYAVTGHAPRHLDRNITVVGRVVSGMALLSTLPRGHEAMGFYGATEVHPPITSMRLAADVPEAERSHLEVMRTDSATYKAAVEAQRNRGGPWNKYAAGYVELCNVPIPVREQPKP